MSEGEKDGNYYNENCQGMMNMNCLRNVHPMNYHDASRYFQYVKLFYLILLGKWLQNQLLYERKN